MKAACFTIFTILCSIIVIAPLASGGEKIGERLGRVLSVSNPNDEIVLWVYFTDKGSLESMRSSVPQTVVSPRSIQRRLKVRPMSEVVDYSDLPVEEGYVEQIASHVIRVRQRSKWFNSVSVIATKSQIAELETLPIVKTLELLARFKKNQTEENFTTEAPQKEIGGNERETSVLDLNYGQSLGQLAQLNVPAVHNTGNYAQGVIVGVFDDGVRLPSHQAFDSLHIIATYDFVEHKVSVVPTYSPSGFHGVNTLSTIGGYAPGQLIGPAFGASYILARTEEDTSETPIEEDNWAAAIEWADSIGVEVTSTSLGYLDYDPPYTSWTWQDMNGHTTVITNAADMAVARGIVVLNSAGNAGFNTVNTLGAPADGDSVLAIGAVDASGIRVSFSSVGPTTSVPPRIKPDVMAQGSSVRVASSSNPTGYGFSSGTSFSCPLSAGVAALIVKARPNATPVQIGNAMRMTASNAGSPDNLMGWGIINAVAAINYLSAVGTGTDPQTPTHFRLEQNYPNPFNPTTSIRYQLATSGHVTLKVFDVLGKEIATIVNEAKPAGSYEITWNASNVASGVYIYRLEAGSFFDAKKLLLVK